MFIQAERHNFRFQTLTTQESSWMAWPGLQLIPAGNDAHWDAVWLTGERNATRANQVAAGTVHSRMTEAEV